MKLRSHTRVAMYKVQKGKMPRIFLRYSITGILVLVTVLLISATWSNYQKYSGIKDITAQAVRSYESLDAKEARLKSEIARLESPLGREAELRKKYGVGKPGERVYVFIGEGQ